ncbi:hypothetical protein CR513_01685, partial [Mucuna pruriens]
MIRFICTGQSSFGKSLIQRKKVTGLKSTSELTTCVLSSQDTIECRIILIPSISESGEDS